MNPASQSMEDKGGKMALRGPKKSEKEKSMKDWGYQNNKGTALKVLSYKRRWVGVVYNKRKKIKGSKYSGTSVNKEPFYNHQARKTREGKSPYVIQKTRLGFSMSPRLMSN